MIDKKSLLKCNDCDGFGGDTEQCTKCHGQGRMQQIRKTPIGTILYFSSEKEIRNLFTPYFHIDDLKTIEISGKYAPHLAIYALMSKR